MASAPEAPSAIVRAAEELEDELRRCEEAAAEAARVRLNTEKNIGRAARALKTAAEHRDQMGGKLKALLSAIKDAGARAEAAASRMETRAGELAARMERLQALQARAGQIAAAVRDATEFARQAKDPHEIVERLGPVEEQIARAQEEARADDFDDVAHDIAGLRDLLASLRRKLEGK
jgi:chromosome segregation ATPase